MMNSKQKKKYKSCSKKAANQLHHTANVSKKSYADNEIITLYVDNPLKFKDVDDMKDL